MTPWSGPPLVGERLVVVAPHPDDEILCAGGMMRWTARSGRDVVVVRLGFPDGGCAEHVDDIADAIAALLRTGDLVVGPSSADGHRDVVGVAVATSIAAPPVVDDWWEAPTWALVHGTAAAPVSTLALDEMAWAAKQHAMAAYRSQLVPLGPVADDGPVVHPHELELMLRPTEQFAVGGVSERVWWTTARAPGGASEQVSA